MNTAEIIKREVQGDSGFQIVQLFRESIGQSGKPSHLHSHGQVLSFHVRRADVILVRLSLSNLGYNLDDRAWGVFRFAVMLPIIAVQLYQLGKVNICAERSFNSVNVEPESVCSDLYAVIESLRKIIHKVSGSGSGTLAYHERGNQFCFRVNCDKHPLVAKLCRIIFAYSTLLFKAKSPYLIALDEIALQIAHSLIHEPRAALSGQNEQLHNRVPMQSCKALCRANGAAFYQALDSAESNIFRDTHGSKGANRLGVRKGCRAGSTAVTLDSQASVTAKFLNCSVLAFNAGHGFSPLALCGETSQNNLGSEAWVTPRFGFATAKGATDAVAVLLKHLIFAEWWAANHFRLPAFLKRSALESRGVSHLTKKSFLLPFYREVRVNLTIKSRQCAWNVLIHLEALGMNPFPYSPALFLAFQNHVNGRKGICVSVHIMPKVYEPSFYVGWAKPFWVFGSQNVCNFVSHRSVFKQVFGFLAGSDRDSHIFTKGSKVLNVLPNNNNPLFQFFSLCKQVQQFTLGCFVSLPVRRGICHG